MDRFAGRRIVHSQLMHNTLTGRILALQQEVTWRMSTCDVRLSGVFDQNLMHIMVMRFKKALQDWIARRAGEVYLKQETDTEKKTSTTISGVTIAAVWFALHEHRALSAASCTFEYTNASNLRPRAELRPSFVEGGLAAGKPARI